MIFVTVGTHEQQFNRVIQAVDELKRCGVIEDEVIIQSGYSTYEVKECFEKKFLSYDEMNAYAERCTVMITHGGPASIFLAYEYGKIPIVVPRKPEFKEHVDNHQVLFARRLASEEKILLVEDILELKEKISSIYNKKYSVENNNTDNFCGKVETIVNELII